MLRGWRGSRDGVAVDFSAMLSLPPFARSQRAPERTAKTVHASTERNQPRLNFSEKMWTKMGMREESRRAARSVRSFLRPTMDCPVVCREVQSDLSVLRRAHI
jgi:hypothetical protein